MPHKHKRKADGDDSHYELPPSARATALPVSSHRNSQPASRNNNKKRKTANIAGYGKDDTPKAFSRLINMRKQGKPRSGLDNGPQQKPKKKKAVDAAEDTGGAGEAVQAVEKDTDVVDSEQQNLKILPGEKLSEFNQRVNQALPLAGLQKSGKRIDGVKDHKVTKHEKKLKRLQDGWRKEEARIREKEQEERELAEEEQDEIDAMWEDHVGEMPSQGGKKGKKGKRKLVAGEIDTKEEDPWDALQRKKQKAKLHDVVQAPPEFTRVPREIFKVKNGAKVNVGNVPNAAGSLRKREELGVERQTIIDTYRKLMEAKRSG